MRRIMAVLALICLLGAAPIGQLNAAASNAQRDLNAQPQRRLATNAYIVVMEGDPAIKVNSAAVGTAAARSAKGQSGRPSAAAMQQRSAQLRQQQDQILRAAGIDLSVKTHNFTVALNGVSVRLTPQQVEKLSKQPGVRAVIKDEIRYPQADSPVQTLEVANSGTSTPSRYTGAGVVVGVIDTGIWPEHPSFADDGTYPPPVITLENTADNPSCNFGNKAQNPNDKPFKCNNKLIGAREFLNTYRALTGFDADEFDSARDDNGHGTHTASTAAGNANVAATVFGVSRGKVSGIAPRAQVVAYKALGKLGGYTSDLAAAIDQAVADGVNVINYSIGGGASLTGADDIAFLFAADAGVFVATSAGNSGPGAATIGSPAAVPWITTVGANTKRQFYQARLDLGGGRKIFGASITKGTGVLPLADAATLGNELCLIGGFPNPSQVAGKIILCKRGSNGRVDKSKAVYDAGGKGMILYNANDVDNLFTDNFWVPTVHIDLTPGLQVKDYIARTAKPTAQITPTPDAKLGYAPSMTIFSSRGPDPVAEDIIKPDVTAPGLQILAGNTPLTNEGVQGELFQAIAGTSMSSPHVAGLFALIKQAHPEWSAAIAKSAIMTTANQNVLDNDRKSKAGPFAMGAGEADLSGKTIKNTPFQPGLAYDAGFVDYLGFLCEAGPEVFANPTATCANLAAAGIPTTARNLNLPSIGIASVTGSETVTRTITSIATEPGVKEYRAYVKTPPGFKVTVKPVVIKLAPGESATFSVTISNVKAPIGEWSFGSLSWMSRDHQYDAYSPIAVRASQLLAPSEIIGSGTSGSTSFPVKFGYTGTYQAAAHGLVEATITSATVKQDPDQTFDPSDGYSNAHTFNLSGAAFFRVAIPPDATEPDADLDVYVFNPQGELVAQSTAGGTDELVDIASPEDGTWTVFVHGWSTPGGSSDYNMESWIIPAASGGSLTLVSAPTSAVNAQTGTVTVSWSGLTAGKKYLGAVSHSDGSDVLGLTLIDVNP